MSEVKKCCTYRTVRTALLKSTVNMCIESDAKKSMLKIKPCAIREDLHRRKYRNHDSVICETVMPIHETVAFLPFSSALPQNGKPDRVLL